MISRNMRTSTWAVIWLLVAALVLSACNSRVTGAANDSDVPEPPQSKSNASPDATGSSASSGEEILPTRSSFDCESLLNQVALGLGSDWVEETHRNCYTTLTNAAEGLEIGIRSYAPPLDSDGYWSLDRVYPVTVDLHTVVATGSEGTYQGVMFYLPPEKTGGEWWGPTPVVLAAVGSEGMVSVQCNTAYWASNKGEGEEAQLLVDTKCPNILSQVRFGNLGLPVPLRLPR